MLIIGLTGGIGSGKTTVINMFQELGVEIYITDVEAKRLMNSESNLIEQIKELLGEQAYQNNTLNSVYVAEQVFVNKALLQQLNALVHPAVKIDFKSFIAKIDAPYVIYESAILFESGSHKLCDYTLTVSAPEELRIERVIQRDQLSKKAVKNRMQNQLTDEIRNSKADFVLNNINLQETKKEVLKLHEYFLTISKDS